jgi:sensor histidine kinase YesM
VLLAHALPIVGPRSRRNLAVHAGATLAFALTTVALYRLARTATGLPSQRAFGFDLITGIHAHILTYWIVVGIVVASAYYRRAREREVHAAELSAELSRARLEALTMQLHPHFLFNTMHAISSAVRDDPEGAEDMLAELADLLRATLERPAGDEVTLREERDFIERYIGIQRVRFGDRLEVCVSIDDDALDVLVPAFILQPIVENAIEHGIAKRLRGGRLAIEADTTGGVLRIFIRDDGPGMGDTTDRDGRARVGIANTRARLAHMDGGAGVLDLSDSDQAGVTAALRIPLHRAPVS